MKLKKGKAAEKMAKDHVVKKKKKKNLAEVTTDEFFNQDFENMDVSDVVVDRKEEIQKQQKPSKKEKLKSTKKSSNDVSNKTKEKKKIKSKTEENDSDSGESNLDPREHKKSLMKLQKTDPEFFSYLKTHDTKLLDFNVDDEDGDGASFDEDDDLKHIPDGDLEVGSDDSDYEAEGADTSISKDGQIKVTFKLLKTWEEELKQDKSSKTIRCVVEAFHAALETVSESENPSTQYKIEGGAIFNGIVQLCILHIPKAFKKFLKLGDETRFEAHKAKRFSKVKGVLRSYLSDLIKVLDNISSANIITTLLKHLHQMLPYTQSFSSLRKPLLRILIKYWSTGEEETVRVVAFLCIVKIATSQASILDALQKTMYYKYVENAKFVSPTTLPGINFMRLSLTEIYRLDSDVSYKNAFVYIRQLAIHLRNALTLKKKEHFQMVYNWQYINSLWFWIEFIAKTKNQSLLRSLLYPLVQVTIGVIKLIPTSQYYPLRFHCVKMLIYMSKEANVFIPSLPFLVEILECYDFNKRHKVVSMKPISLMCLLRVSKSQAQENGYKDAIIDNIYELILESAAKDSYTIYFPDMYVPCIIQLKAFLKKCHVANYCRKFKQLLEKIEEGRKFLETERAKRSFDLLDMRDIELWENKLKESDTPITKFYNSWIRIREAQKLKLVTQNDELADLKLPKITRRPKKRRDSDEDSDLEIPVEEMDRRLAKEAKKGKTKAKKIKRVDNVEMNGVESMDSNDIVKDIKSSDWD